MQTESGRSLDEIARILKRPDERAARPDEPARGARSFGRVEPGRKGAEPDARSEGLPKGLVIAGEIAIVAGMIAVGVFGPAYYTCHRMKDEGLFFYGTTVRSCVWDRVGEKAASAEGFVRDLVGKR